MRISDESFEFNMQILEADGLPGTAAELRARDTAQREALARVEAEAGRLAEAGLAAHVKATAAHAQLAEAVGLLGEIAEEENEEVPYAAILDFLARHAQAEKQEALSDAELMEVAMFEGAGNKAARRAHELGVAELPEHLAPRPQEAQGAQAGDELDAIAEAIFNADKDNWFSVGPYPQLHANDKARLRAMARAALATQPADDRAREMGYRSAINALDDLDRHKMAMSPATSVPEATQQQLNDLNNFFNSVCEGGLHSVEKSGIQSLTELGALENCGFGKHRLTRFGTYLLDQTAVRGAEHGQ